jgi:hypothetical protein
MWMIIQNSITLVFIQFETGLQMLWTPLRVASAMREEGMRRPLGLRAETAVLGMAASGLMADVMTLMAASAGAIAGLGDSEAPFMGVLHSLSR